MKTETKPMKWDSEPPAVVGQEERDREADNLREWMQAHPEAKEAVWWITGDLLLAAERDPDSGGIFIYDAHMRRYALVASEETP